MIKAILTLIVATSSSVVIASGGGGGGSGGAAAGGSSSRAKEVSPQKVYDAREAMRRRVQASKKLSKVTKVNFDHNFSKFSTVLGKTVKLHNNQQKSSVDYKKLDSKKVDSVVENLLSLGREQVMNDFSKSERLAYFINLYNALTLKLIKDNLDTIKKKSNSIKDLGKFLKDPWEQSFFTLFGKKRTLNDIEHGFIRGELKGDDFKQSKKEFSDPRIHFAVNCASKGCPALLQQAFTADKLDEQMQTAMVNFLKDRDRNYVEGNKLFLSPIISNWYEKDFERGLLGYNSVKDFAAKNAEHLADDPKTVQLIKDKKLKIKSSLYSWKLNDAI